MADVEEVDPIDASLRANEYEEMNADDASAPNSESAPSGDTSGAPATDGSGGSKWFMKNHQIRSFHIIS